MMNTHQASSGPIMHFHRKASALLLIICCSCLAKTVTVHGNWSIIDYKDHMVPGSGCFVYIWDADLVYDDLIDVVMVDDNGDWSSTFDNNDGILSDCYDVYVEYTTRSPLFEVNKTGDLAKTEPGAGYGFGTHDQILNDIQSDHDYGYWTVNTDDITTTNAFKVFSALKEGSSFVITNSAIGPHPVICKFPDQSEFTQGWSFLGFSQNAYMRIAPEDIPNGSSIMHEYGHAIMYYAMGEWLPAEGQMHYLESAISKEFAFTEGWPSFFQAVVRNDPAFVWGFGARQCYEYSRERHVSIWPVGDITEGRNTMALWDLYDSENERSSNSIDNMLTPPYTGLDVFSGGIPFFVAQWGILNSQRINNLYALWELYKPSLSADDQQKGLSSLLENTIDYNAYLLFSHYGVIGVFQNYYMLTLTTYYVVGPITVKGSLYLPDAAGLEHVYPIIDGPWHDYSRGPSSTIREGSIDLSWPTYDARQRDGTLGHEHQGHISFVASATGYLDYHGGIKTSLDYPTSYERGPIRTRTVRGKQSHFVKNAVGQALPIK